MRNPMITALLLSIPGLGGAGPARAHIKWFVEFDVADPPLPFLQIVSPLFLVLALLAAAVIFFAVLIDERWSRAAPLALDQKLKFAYRNDDIALSIVRIGVGVFCVMRWMVGGIALTPETSTDVWWIPGLHLLIAFAVLFRQTLFVAGAGIMVLFGYCVYRYGLFHMVDYLTFLGLALFLIFSQIGTKALLRLRLPLLYLTLAIAFLWSAIEKLTFPQWFDPFLDRYSFLQMGLDREFFLLSAAFVEFALFYLLLTGKNAVTVVAVAANILIITGNIYFGKTDAIGHFPVNFVLVLMAIMGARNFTPLAGRGNGGIPLYAARQAGLFVVFLGAVLLSYYGLHWVQYESFL